MKIKSDKDEIIAYLKMYQDYIETIKSISEFNSGETEEFCTTLIKFLTQKEYLDCNTTYSKDFPGIDIYCKSEGTGIQITDRRTNRNTKIKDCINTTFKRVITPNTFKNGETKESQLIKLKKVSIFFFSEIEAEEKEKLKGAIEGLKSKGIKELKEHLERPCKRNKIKKNAIDDIINEAKSIQFEIEDMADIYFKIGNSNNIKILHEIKEYLSNYFSKTLKDLSDIKKVKDSIQIVNTIREKNIKFEDEELNKLVWGVSENSPVVRKKEYKVVEFFAGAGGLALGLEKAGFSTLLLNEFDKHAASTLRKNRPEWQVVEDDIINLIDKGVSKYLKPGEEVDLISGGYPCQAFSYAGKGLGLEDARGTLFYPFAKAIVELKPKMFLAENVRGLVSHEGGKTLKTMIEVYESLGYDVKYQVMNALNYGVAQKRERVAIVGIRRDLKEKYNLDYKFPEPYDYKLNLGDILKNVPESEGLEYSVPKKEIMEMVPPGGSWKDIPNYMKKKYSNRLYRPSKFYNKYSWSGQGWENFFANIEYYPCHPEEIRPFTVREEARIKGFPDEWEFMGAVWAKYKQIGNAVPVNFAEAIGKSITDILNKIEE